MNIEAISSAATVALACTTVFVLAAKFWQLLTRSLFSSPNFSDCIMRESAQRFRDELDQLSHTQATYLGAGLVFALIFGVAHTLQAQQLFAGYPTWQLNIVIGTLGAAAAFGLYRLGRTTYSWRRVKFLRDANVAVGHQLQCLISGYGRVYHDIPTSAGVIDHVIVGQSGIYAVNVIARRRARKGKVRLRENHLLFIPSGAKLSIVDIKAKTTRLERDFGNLLGHAVRVRSVIAVPGWQITGQSEGHLVVNESTLPMLSGWKDQADYLLNEDVDVLQNRLTSHCKRSAGYSVKTVLRAA